MKYVQLIVEMIGNGLVLMEYVGSILFFILVIFLAVWGFTTELRK